MKRTRAILPLLLLAALLLTGCGQTAAPAETSAPEPAETPAPTMRMDQTATAADMTTVEDVVPEGREPVYASSLEDGSYDVQVDCSSSMFRIDRCVLTIADGGMQAELLMNSDSYLYLYPGTAEEAAAAGEESYIPLTEGEDGMHHALLPVESLDSGVSCAAFSRKKELWYDRTLCFRSDSLPLEAFRADQLATVESLDLADGQYTTEVRLEGGSGKASLESPALLTVDNGLCTAEIRWGSSHYDYMKVGGEQYFPVNSEGNSCFVIPVPVFDRPFAVVADTTAMSEPHEITYSLCFSSDSLAKAESAA